MRRLKGAYFFVNLPKDFLFISYFIKFLSFFLLQMKGQHKKNRLIFHRLNICRYASNTLFQSPKTTSNGQLHKLEYHHSNPQLLFFRMRKTDFSFVAKFLIKYSHFYFSGFSLIAPIFFNLF